jgi:hypothetical protein
MAPSTPPRRLRRPLLLAAGLVGATAAVVLCVAYSRWHASAPLGPKLEPGLPSPDPRLGYRGPFENVRPEVAYVSDTLCADCHPLQAKTYSRHPMARTLMPLEPAFLPPLDAPVHNPFGALGQRFEVVSRGRQVLQVRTAQGSKGEPLFRQELETQFAIGSGTHAHSYLSMQGETVLQTPISWFTQARRWDLSPGFGPDVLAGRRVGGDCLFCHSNGANEDPIEDTTYRRPIFPNGHGIGCQRCHGPGGEHVKDPRIVKPRGGSGLDPTIVNPAHLGHHLRESICWQCHLEGDVRVLRRGRQRFDFRPGMPLEDFVAVFVDAEETNFDDVVNQVEQMRQSRCYQKSTEPGKLGCVSCHDPHEVPAPDRAVAHYRAACLKCHGPDACSLPRPQRLARHKDDSCVACHMPPFGTANIAHVSATDHRIPRKPAARKADRPPGLRMGEVRDLVSVYDGRRGEDDPERERDWALAAALLTRRGREVAQPFLGELEAAAKRDPADLLVRAEYGLALVDAGKAATALPLFEDVLARRKDYGLGLLGRAIACSQLGKTRESLTSWRRLVELEPSHVGYRRGLLELLIRETRWKEAQQAAQSWVAADPGLPEARAVLRDVLLRLGRLDDAKEQDRIVNELTRR